MGRLDVQDETSLLTPLLTAIEKNCNDRGIIKSLMSNTAEAVSDAVAYAAEKNRVIVLDELIRNDADFVAVALEDFEAKPAQQLLRAALLRKRLLEFNPETGAETLRIILLQLERYGVPRLDEGVGTCTEIKLVRDTLGESAKLAADRCLLNTVNLLTGPEIVAQDTSGCPRTDCTWTKEGGKWIAKQDTGLQDVVSLYCLSDRNKVFTYINLVDSSGETCSRKDGVRLASKSEAQGCTKEVCKQSIEAMDNMCSDGVNVEDAFVDAVNSNQAEIVENLLPHVADQSLVQEGLLYAVEQKFDGVVGKILDMNPSFHKDVLKEALLVASAAGSLETVKQLLKIRKSVVFSRATLETAEKAAAGNSASNIRTIISEYKLKAPKKDMSYQLKKVTQMLPFIGRPWPKKKSQSAN